MKTAYSDFIVYFYIKDGKIFPAEIYCIYSNMQINML